jgi:hypothetical protein
MVWPPGGGKAKQEVIWSTAAAPRAARDWRALQSPQQQLGGTARALKHRSRPRRQHAETVDCRCAVPLHNKSFAHSSSSPSLQNGAAPLFAPPGWLAFGKINDEETPLRHRRIALWRRSQRMPSPRSASSRRFLGVWEGCVVGGHALVERAFSSYAVEPTTQKHDSIKCIVPASSASCLNIVQCACPSSSPLPQFVTRLSRVGARPLSMRVVARRRGRSSQHVVSTA